jgi:hypothetical protein
MKKSLYAYFGLLDLHNIDSPGHSLYQIGLVDSLRESFGEEKFDFYSYYPEEVIKSADLQCFPETNLGKLFLEYRDRLFNDPIHDIEALLKKIENREYSRLYLKARFRNLSTLSKKWKDALDFEKIIECAIRNGYTETEIIILDTDLSLSEKFINDTKGLVTILIPSIDFPGISNMFLVDCVKLNLSQNKIALSSVFYGNIDTSKYKSGNSKSEILPDVLEWISMYYKNKKANGFFYLICKRNDYDSFTKKEDSIHLNRNSRAMIWDTLETSSIMINVTKEKYNELKFIPARIFEAMIFGMIPISYKFNFLCPAFSFDTLDDLHEIYAYLTECDQEGLEQAYKHFINSYIDYLKSNSTAYSG